MRNSRSLLSGSRFGKRQAACQKRRIDGGSLLKTITARRSKPQDRIDGYAPIGEYAALGDGRTIALVSRDGSIDWLCLPDMDSPGTFARLLDANRGGYFEIRPALPFEVERRYIPGTNVLETVFFTSAGTVRVVDCMTLPDDNLSPFRELARLIEGLSGHVPMEWRVEPRFGFGTWRTRIDIRQDIPVATARSEALAVCAWGAGTPACSDVSISGSFVARENKRALLVISAASQEPLVFPDRESVEARIEKTITFWRRWSSECYQGLWQDAVQRSALALKLLVFAPSGALAAAATTSLPEQLGGERNWDYRFCWIRDAAFILNAMLRLKCSQDATSFFWWFMHASQLTHPYLKVLYSLDGGTTGRREQTLPLEGYRRSSPVRIGNAATEQLQLDVYGALMDTAWLYGTQEHRFDPETAKRLVGIANLVCDIWKKPDSGIWEVRSAPLQFTHSKVMCWVALDRATQLARDGKLPAPHAARWKREAESIREYVETQCWSEQLQSYLRSAGSLDLDASLLLMPIVGFVDARSPRFQKTIDAIGKHLAHGPLVDRYTCDDGLSGCEGSFLTCSFWMVHALALAGRIHEATERMEQLVELANDVGLYAEEYDASSGEMLGNFPQGLVHLSLVHAAIAISEGMK